MQIIVATILLVSRKKIVNFFCQAYFLLHFLHLQTSADIVDEEVEPQPLWEYPGVALSQATQLLSLNFTKPITCCHAVDKTITLICEE